jgi:hypothetical protein
MARGSCILGLLTVLLVLQTSGQGTTPTLADTMKLIANAFNSRETISWKETIPDLLGANYTVTSSKPTEVNADPSSCSLAWTSVYTSSDDKLVESFLIKLGTVTSVVVQPYSQYRQSAMQYKFEVSPETYVVLVNTDVPVAGEREQFHKDKLKSKPKPLNDREARVVFADVQTANTVAGSIRRAVEMCPATRSGP